jgi:tripeptide aminopeptidase
MRRACLILLPVVTFLAFPAAAQPPYPSKFSPTVAADPTVKDALAYLDEKFDDQVAEWIRITEIPAKSTFEQKRAAYVRAQLEALGLQVTLDEAGNVTARRPGTGGGPTIVFAAHMDTVHPMDTDLHVTRADGRLHAPGIFDNSASVANMLQAARALDAAKVRTRGDVYFVATVQEELGLEGMDHWLDEHKGVPDMVVALDGGLGPVDYGALGIYWSRMIFTGEGSHTLTSRGRPHPGRAAATAILDIYRIPLPDPNAPVGAVYNVGMIEGGKVVNAIPQEVWFTVDLRTVDPDLLAKLDAEIVGTCEAAATAEGVTFRREYIQRSEAGGRPEQLAGRRAHPLVQTAVDVLTYLGVDLPKGGEALPTGSTDSNAAVVRGIPSISVGRAYGGNQHTLSEWADVDSAKIGTKQIVLLAASLAELSPGR